MNADIPMSDPVFWQRQWETFAQENPYLAHLWQPTRFWTFFLSTPATMTQEEMWEVLKSQAELVKN